MYHFAGKTTDDIATLGKPKTHGCLDKLKLRLAAQAPEAPGTRGGGP